MHHFTSFLLKFKFGFLVKKVFLIEGVFAVTILKGTSLEKRLYLSLPLVLYLMTLSVSRMK
jgi:hypothetical protein